VHAIDGFDGIPLQHPFLDHQSGPALVLFGGLEDKMDRSGEISRLGEVLGRTEQHCGMAVMTTGMHAAVMLRGMREIVLLVDVQRIHIGAQRNRAAARHRSS
jgi:hypothetical protein